MSPSDPDPLSLAGTLVAEKYLIERLVAEGGFSLVYRATHVSWKQPCVLKFLKGLSAVRPEKRERLVASMVREGALLRELSSRTASILQAHDLGTWTSPEGEAYPFLVLEWLDGQTLAEAIEGEKKQGQRPLSLVEVVRLFDPMVRALAAAHRKGIAHRDIKPENVFVCGALRSEDTYLKLLDFGVAQMMQDAGAQPDHKSSMASQAAFTPWYGAPEQFNPQHGPTGPWTDVFALALLLVEMLTYEQPLSGDDVLELAAESMHPSVRPTPRARGAEVPDEVEAAFARALSVRIDERYQNAAIFWSDLRRALGLESIEIPTQSSASNAPPGLAPIPAATSGSDVVTLPNPGTLSSIGETNRSPTESQPAGSPRWLWGVIGASVMVLVGGGAMLLGMKVQSGRTTTAPLASAPVASSVAAAPRAPVEPTCPEGMAKIPGGDFYMGYDGEGALPFETPPHPVKLDAFCIDVTEVTVERYRECTESGKCRRAGVSVSWPGATAIQKKVYGPLCNIDDPGRDRHPINCVDWEMADNFCQRQNRRLPTSAEWEFAVRGPDGRTYPWGDIPPDANHLNACGKECIDWGKKNGVAAELTAMHQEDDGFPTTAPVGSFPKGRSRYGLDDVIGNVMEWVQDWDGEYDKGAQVNPRGPDKGTDRVIRGGAWNAGHAFWVRPSFRFKFPPETLSHGIGFRCAADLVRPAAP